MPDFKPTDRPCSRNHLLFKELDDGGVVYDPTTETIHSLNPSAAFIWILCDGNHSIREIIDSVRKHFQEFSANPETEIDQTLHQFFILDLITISS
ncbi:MAG: PqqD family protein [Candidatus Neomarinimicrobiota bacterium]